MTHNFDSVMNFNYLNMFKNSDMNSSEPEIVTDYSDTNLNMNYLDQLLHNTATSLSNISTDTITNKGAQFANDDGDDEYEDDYYEEEEEEDDAEGVDVEEEDDDDEDDDGVLSINKYIINRTNSNGSCTSTKTNKTTNSIESGYLTSSNDNSSIVSCESSISSPSNSAKILNNKTLNNISNKIKSANETDLIVEEKKVPKHVVTGCYGRAKNQEQISPDYIPIISSLHKNNSVKIERMNFGDDCAYTYSNIQENRYYFGLADGVSANRLRGYDAKLFPNALLDACTQFILNQSKINTPDCSSNSLVKTFKSLSISANNDGSSDHAEDDENDDLFYNEVDDEDDAYDKLLDNDCKFLYNILLNSHNLVQEQCVYGSSTVCLLALDLNINNNKESASLSTCNLGDSGYMIIRDNKVIYKSLVQSHRYNAPYQLGCTPPELLEHDLYRDKPEDSVCLIHEVKSGDFLIVSSDGLFDNLYEDEIALIIDNHIHQSTLSSTISNHDSQISDYTTMQDSILQSSTNNTSNSATTTTSTVIHNKIKITSELLNSTCEILVQKASQAGIKRDDMLIMLIYID